MSEAALPKARGRIGLGLWTAALIALADQGTKRAVLDLYELAERGRVAVTPFFDLVLVWNRGISYGLFQQETTAGRLALLAITLAAIVFCLYWLTRAEGRLTALALGLVVGGAIGNGIDRAIYGAVVDFVSLHYAGFYWYVFNIADIAIVAGAGLLLYESLFDRDRAG